MGASESSEGDAGGGGEEAPPESPMEAVQTQNSEMLMFLFAIVAAVLSIIFIVIEIYVLFVQNKDITAPPPTLTFEIDQEDVDETVAIDGNESVNNNNASLSERAKAAKTQLRAAKRLQHERHHPPFQSAQQWKSTIQKSHQQTQPK